MGQYVIHIWTNFYFIGLAEYGSIRLKIRVPAYVKVSIFGYVPLIMSQGTSDAYKRQFSLMYNHLRPSIVIYDHFEMLKQEKRGKNLAILSPKNCQNCNFELLNA